MRNSHISRSAKFWGFKLISSFVYSQLVRGKLSISEITNNHNLAHYSSSRKGSAFYYQQIKYNNIVMSQHNAEHFAVPTDIKKNINRQYAENYQLYNLPSKQKFILNHQYVTSVRQVRPSVDSLGYFKLKVENVQNPALKNSLLSSKPATARHGTSLRAGHFYNFYRWAALQNQLHTATSPTFRSSRERLFGTNLRVRSALKYGYGLNMNRLRDLRLTNNWVLGVWSGKLVQLITKFSTGVVYFIRTVWFRTIFNTNRTLRQRSLNEWGHITSTLLLSTGSFSAAYSMSDSSFYATPALAHWEDELIDPDRNSRQPTSSRKRRFFNRKHFTLRIGLGFWGKKLWQFKKSRQFWNYVRSAYRYMFRAFKTFNLFQNRLDVFILRFFTVRNMVYARSLIRAGHVFVGNYNPKNPMFQVERHAVVSLSRKATIWTAGKVGFVKTHYLESQDEKKDVRRAYKAAALRYSRQQKDLYILGEKKLRKFAMYYGDPLDVIVADSRKAKFFSLNYFYAQKVVNSAWW